MAGTMSRTARAATVRWGLKEAERKLPARGTRSAYKAPVSGRGGMKTQSPVAIRKGWVYMRRVYGRKVGVQYPGRSVRPPKCYFRHETGGWTDRSQQRV
jgi:hypothetical protein